MVRITYSYLADRYTVEEVDSIRSALKSLISLGFFDFILHTERQLIVDGFDSNQPTALANQLSDFQHLKSAFNGLVDVERLINKERSNA